MEEEEEGEERGKGARARASEGRWRRRWRRANSDGDHGDDDWVNLSVFVCMGTTFTCVHVVYPQLISFLSAVLQACERKPRV